MKLAVAWALTMAVTCVLTRTKKSAVTFDIKPPVKSSFPGNGKFVASKPARTVMDELTLNLPKQPHIVPDTPLYIEQHKDSHSLSNRDIYTNSAFDQQQGNQVLSMCYG